MTFKELLSWKNLTPVNGYSLPTDMPALDVVTTAGQASPNALFVACGTAVRNGHEEAMAAYERGCRHFVAERMLALPADASLCLSEDTAGLLGVLAEAAHGYPARSLTVVGITGTHGKTSVALLAAGLFTGCGRRVAMLTTDGTDIGGRFVPQGEFAPDAADLARFFRDAVDAGAEIAIVELSAYMLAHGAAEGIPFTVVLGTDLTPRHIGKGEHADMAAYRAAKARLLEMDAPLSVMHVGLADFSPRGRVFTYGLGQEEADFRLLVEGTCRTGGICATALTLVYRGKCYRLETPLRFAACLHNLAAALALAVVLGVPLARLASLTPQVRAVGRADCLYLVGERTVCFDAAYEAEDVLLLLKSLRAETEGKLSVLLGSVGGRAYARRAPLGAAVLSCADFVYFTADDPNGESVTQITHDMVGENDDSARYRVIASRADAIREAALDLRRGDTLVILGKPREETQLVNGKKHFFSDRLALLDAIREL